MNTNDLEIYYNRPIIKKINNKLCPTKNEGSFLTNYRSFTRNNLMINYLIKLNNTHSINSLIKSNSILIESIKK